MTLSMCIPTDAIFFVLSTLVAGNCFFPRVNAGIKSSVSEFNAKPSLKGYLRYKTILCHKVGLDV